MEIVRYLEVGVVKEDLALLASLEGIVRKKEARAEAMAALHSVDDVAALLEANPKCSNVRFWSQTVKRSSAGRPKTCSSSLSE